MCACVGVYAECKEAVWVVPYVQHGVGFHYMVKPA